MTTKNNTVFFSKSRSQILFEDGRIWMICIMAMFIGCFLMIGFRVVNLAITSGVGSQLVNEIKTGNDGGTEISLIGLMRDGVTEESLGINDNDIIQNAVILPRRDIVDRNGVLLSTSLKTASLYAHPQEIREPNKIANLLAKNLPDINLKRVKKRLNSDNKFVWIKHNLTPKEQNKINNLGIAGVYFQDEYTRSYPHGNLFSHILGFVGIDNQGLAGIEKHFDSKLRNMNSQEPFQLSVDMRVQNILREELAKSVKEFRAIGASGIVMHVPTGEILAMANLPDFNPNHPTKHKKDSLFNIATLGTYELGSTFKTFTMALGLEEGVTGMYDGYDVSNPIKVANFSIRDSHPHKRWLSLAEIFAYSSNIGTVRLIMDVGKDKQQDFLKSLGMFDKVDIELPEIGKPIAPSKWKDINMMTISYGHGISVTPLHLVQAIASIINDGHKTKPTLQKQPHNAAKIQNAERIVTKETSHKVRRLLRAVVQYGTGRNAAVEGYRVGGKTGTAEKVKNGRYDRNKKVTSFISAFPMDNPEYIIFAMVDEPKGNKRTHNYATGGWVAAPIVKNVITRIAPMLGVTPIYQKAEDKLDKYIGRRILQEKRRKLHAISY